MGFIFRVERKVGKVLIHILKHIKYINTYCDVRIYGVHIVTIYRYIIYISSSRKRA